MKVITEERLKYLIENDGDGSKVYCTVSPADLQEIDTLTVTKLRPMSDLPQCKYVNAYRLNEGFECIYLNIHNRLVGFCGLDVRKSDFEGWIPMPKYEPESK